MESEGDRGNNSANSRRRTAAGDEDDDATRRMNTRIQTRRGGRVDEGRVKAGNGGELIGIPMDAHQRDADGVSEDIQVHIRDGEQIVSTTVTELRMVAVQGDAYYTHKERRIHEGFSGCKEEVRRRSRRSMSRVLLANGKGVDKEMAGMMADTSEVETEEMVKSVGENVAAMCGIGY